MYKKIITGVLSVAILFSLVVVPASAEGTEYVDKDSFWAWAATQGDFLQAVLGSGLVGTVTGVCSQSSDGRHRASGFLPGTDDNGLYYKCICDLCGDIFTGYESDINSAYDNYAGGYLLRTTDSHPQFSLVPQVSSSSSGGTTRTWRDEHAYFFEFSITERPPILNSAQALEYVFSVPVSGFYCFQSEHFCLPYSVSGYAFIYDPSGEYLRIKCDDFEQFSASNYFARRTPFYHFEAGIEYRYSYSVGFAYTSLGYNTNGVPWGGQCGPISLVPQTYAADQTRPGSLSGDFGIVGADGQIDTVENLILFDEASGTLYNPVTGESVESQDWTYDYATRTYTVVTGDGNTSKVTYGNDQVTIVEPGGTYNVFYVSDPSVNGDGSAPVYPDAPGGTGNSDSGGSAIGNLVEGLFATIGDVLGGLIRGVLQLLTKAVDALRGIGDIFVALTEQVVGYFGTFTGFLGAVFPFLPEEFMTILTLGFILLVAAAVIRKLLGR